MIKSRSASNTKFFNSTVDRLVSKSSSSVAALLSAALFVGVGALPLAAHAETQVAKLDPGIPAYKKTSGVTGNLNSIGSDTLNNVMTLLSEKMKEYYPNVNVQVEGKGSGTAPPALIAGTAQLAPMSRSMKDSEVEQFEQKFGYKPTQIRVAVDALAIFVNKDNPIKSLSLAQADAIFSKSRRRGAAAEITTWKQLGVTGKLADLPISLYGRNSSSGTYGFFKEHVLENGDYRDTVKEQPGSASVVQGVAVDLAGIGYSGIGYVTSGVRALPLTLDSADPVSPSQENAYSGDYPVARFLYVYINKPPGKPIDPLTGEFLRLALSKEGQEIVIKDGYYPLPESVVKEDSALIK